MGEDTHQQRWANEDEILLADMEGVDAARATVAYARDRRHQRGLERWNQLQRIAEVHGLGEPDAFDDVRLRVLRRIIGHLDERVWRDTLAEVRHHVLDAPQEGWFPDLAERREAQERSATETSQLPVDEGIDDQPVWSAAVNEKALFERDRDAVRGMTLTRQEAVARARERLDTEGSTLVVDGNAVHPNPYQDLWVVGYIDPEHPDEILDGSGPIIVPADGDTYELDSLPPRPVEMIGAILPRDEEWD